MKKVISIAFAMLFVTLAFGQQPDSAKKAEEPLYKKFPTLPPFRLLLLDSATWLTKEQLPRKKPVLIMIFSPDCDHCKHEIGEITKNIDKFKKITIVMASFMPFEKIKQFYRFYELFRYSNIAVGRDVNYILPPFYNLRNMPFLAFYDKKGDLIDIHEGSLPIDQLLKKFEN